ncbi:MAG: ADP-ribosylglycohydrolase family protein [Anaerolineaceae bacterium]|nr:ADP-ribosylglycohydrolase family protein [Anaerolineaceae bacterium]
MNQNNTITNNQNGRSKYLSKIQASLIAGAAGDALGYAVKFLHYRDIRQIYGPDGISKYELIGGKARISAGTQMSLFTANGLLFGETRMKLRKVGTGPHTYIPHAYQDWYYTQDPSCHPPFIISWIVCEGDLHSHRAPGKTCLSSLRSGKFGAITRPLNNSCGCGGVIRTAPIGLFYDPDLYQEKAENIIHYAAETAAVTHGHPLGYIPAGMMSIVVNHAVYTEDSLPEIIAKSLKETELVFGSNQYWHEFESLINQAIEMAPNKESDQENLSKLGQGKKLGHEVLAIAIYAALRHELDVDRALVTAVNHDGESDCAGSLCGSILGAYLGLNAISSEWTEPLELRETIMEIGRDLCAHCQTDVDGKLSDPDWMRKYVKINDLNEMSGESNFI